MPVAAALALLVLGYEPLGSALGAVARKWNVLLFIFALMAIAAAAEESGAFAWITNAIVVWGRGSTRRLFVLLFLAGAVLTLALSNDATAVALTPIVFRAVTACGIEAAPFLLASTFVADTASFGLPFANPANVLVIPHPSLESYVAHLGPPQIAAIAINLAIFLLAFRGALRGKYTPPAAVPPSATAIRTLAVLAAIVVAYFVALEKAWPLGVVAAAGAIVALIAARVTPAATARHVSWSTLGLLAALFVVLDAAGRAGIVAAALHELERADAAGYAGITAVAACSAALLSNLANNLPVAAVAAYAARHAAVPHVAYALVAGVDLGPNLTTNGSLATILWLAFLRRNRIRVSGWEYARLGLLVVPPSLAATLAWLWFVR